MDLEGVARWAGGALAGGDTVERTAALAFTAVVGTSFGPGLLPRPGLDQALATGIVAATNHGLVMTSQSACAALARRFVRDDGTPSGRVRSYAAQAAVGAGVAATGAARRACWHRGLVSRCAGRCCARLAGGCRGSAWPGRRCGVAAGDVAVGGRRPGLRVLAAGGGLLAGAALAGWQIYRYHTHEEADPARLGPARDPLTGRGSRGTTRPGRCRSRR